MRRRQWVVRPLSRQPRRRRNRCRRSAGIGPLPCGRSSGSVMEQGNAVILSAALLALGLLAGNAHAEEVGCTSTTFRLFGANDKICVYAFDDPRVPGVACHISQARTGGISGTFGLAEDPSRFSIACRQV